MNTSTQNQAFQIGDNVTVINGYGLHLKGHKVTDVHLSETGEFEYKIDWDCDWVRVEANRLIAEKSCLIEEIGGMSVADRLLKKYAEYDRISVAIDQSENAFVKIHQLRALVEQRTAKA